MMIRLFKLTLESISVSAISEVVLAASVVTINGGSSTSVIGGQFENITLSSGNGVAISGEFVASETLSISGTNFKNCKSESGGAMHVSVTGESVVTITGSIFESCSTTETGNGNGGAVYADLGENGKLQFNPEYTGEDTSAPKTTFKSCTASNGYGGGIYVSSAGSTAVFILKNTGFEVETCACKDGKGGRVYVSCTDGNALLVAANWIGTINKYDSSVLDYYWVTETKAANPKSVSILY